MTLGHYSPSYWGPRICDLGEKNLSDQKQWQYLPIYSRLTEMPSPAKLYLLQNKGYNALWLGTSAQFSMGPNLIHLEATQIEGTCHNHYHCHSLSLPVAQSIASPWSLWNKYFCDVCKEWYYWNVNFYVVRYLCLSLLDLAAGYLTLTKAMAYFVEWLIFFYPPYQNCSWMDPGMERMPWLCLCWSKQLLLQLIVYLHLDTLLH